MVKFEEYLILFNIKLFFFSIANLQLARYNAMFDLICTIICTNNMHKYIIYIQIHNIYAQIIWKIICTNVCTNNMHKYCALECKHIRNAQNR